MAPIISEKLKQKLLKSGTMKSLNHILNWKNVIAEYLKFGRKIIACNLKRSF